MHRDTLALSGEALVLHYRVLQNSLRVNEIMYLGNYVVQYRTHILFLKKLVTD